MRTRTHVLAVRAHRAHRARAEGPESKGARGVAWRVYKMSGTGPGQGGHHESMDGRAASTGASRDTAATPRHSAARRVGLDRHATPRHAARSAPYSLLLTSVGLVISERTVGGAVRVAVRCFVSDSRRGLALQPCSPAPPRQRVVRVALQSVAKYSVAQIVQSGI